MEAAAWEVAERERVMRREKTIALMGGSCAREGNGQERHKERVSATAQGGREVGMGRTTLRKMKNEFDPTMFVTMSARSVAQ